jgi:hypothetical protein
MAYAAHGLNYGRRSSASKVTIIAGAPSVAL